MIPGSLYRTEAIKFQLGLWPSNYIFQFYDLLMKVFIFISAMRAIKLGMWKLKIASTFHRLTYRVVSDMYVYYMYITNN